MRAFKIIEENWICKNQEYRLNKKYFTNKEIIMDTHGFHSCEYLFECYGYCNNKYGNLHVCEVEIEGELQKSHNRIVSNTITILRELSQQEIEDILRKESSLLTPSSWIQVSSKQKLSKEFVLEFKQQVSWMEISKSPYISESFISANKDLLDWIGVCSSRILSEEFLVDNMAYIEWEYTLSKQKVSEKNLIKIVEFLLRHKHSDYMASIWCILSTEQDLSEYFIKKYMDYLDLDRISYHQKLSESFITENFDRLNKEYIVEKQKLSEVFLRIHWKDLNWTLIPLFQEMSEKLIDDFSEYVDWFNVFIKQKISEEFRSKFKDRLNFI